MSGFTGKNVHFDDTYLHVELEDGRIISTPMKWYPELVAAPVKAIRNYCFICDGAGIEWPTIDYHLSIEAMLKAPPQPNEITAAAMQELLRNSTLTPISRIIELAHANPNIAVLWLYGSRAKGTEQANSDYDLAVAFNHFPENPWDRRLQPELLAMEWADELGVAEGVISVADINHIPLPLALSIITTGKALMVKDSLRLAKEENRITSMWEIDHEYHRRHYG